MKKEEKYFVNFNAGSGNFIINNLEKAKRLAKRKMGFTQKDVDIYDLVEDRLILKSKWNDTPPEKGDKNVLASFGSYGYFADWEVCKRKAFSIENVEL